MGFVGYVCVGLYNRDMKVQPNFCPTPPSLPSIHGMSPLFLVCSSRLKGSLKYSSGPCSVMRNNDVKEVIAMKNNNSVAMPTKESASGEELSAESYNYCICDTCKVGNIDDAMTLLAQMESLGCRPNYSSYTSLIEALLNVGRTLEADALFQEMVCFGLKPRLRLYNIMLRGLLKKGLLGLADRVLKMMEELGVSRNQETYEILLDYNVNAGRLEDT